MEENSPQGIWDPVADKMLLEFAESGLPIFRATTPLSRCKLQSKGRGKLSIHFAADQETIETIFRIIVFANQLNLYGGSRKHVWRMWIPSRTIDQGNLMWWWDNQLSSVKSRQKFLWIMTTQRIRIFCCNDMKNESTCFHKKTKWVNFVWMQDSYMLLKLGQYFMTKDTGEQFCTKACREYTLPRNDGSSQPKGWIQGNTKIGPVLGNHDQLSVR